MSAERRGRLTQVRPAADDDADLLVAWHADPGVSRYWDAETFTRDEILDRLRRPDVDSYIVEADGEPVGFIQAWREEDEQPRGGLDMFLVPDARGRGLGPDPYTWNEPAIRAWRRTGFVDVETRPADDEHTSAWLLMAFLVRFGIVLSVAVLFRIRDGRLLQLLVAVVVAWVVARFVHAFLRTRRFEPVRLQPLGFILIRSERRAPRRLEARAPRRCDRPRRRTRDRAEARRAGRARPHERERQGPARAARRRRADPDPDHA